MPQWVGMSAYFRAFKIQDFIKIALTVPKLHLFWLAYLNNFIEPIMEGIPPSEAVVIVTAPPNFKSRTPYTSGIQVEAENNQVHEGTGLFLTV